VHGVADYFARAVEEVAYGPGAWRGIRVGVFRREGEREVQIGEYERNYPALLRTFSPFRLQGRDLALYSPDYTATRLMELPSCRDIGGEEPASDGFCPVDFLVPHYLDLEVQVNDQPPRTHRKQMPEVADLTPRTIPVKRPGAQDSAERVDHHRHTPRGPLTYHPFGFVAGCIWGDDSSWKVQYLDLARAPEGVLSRDARFGQLELPDNMSLEQAIELAFFDYGEERVERMRIHNVRTFSLVDGQPVDPDDL
jgi:hypothetical protein